MPLAAPIHPLPARPFALPRPYTAVFLMYTTNTSVLKPYIRNVMPAGGPGPLPEHLALSGWPDAEVHDAVNFALS